MFSSKNKFNSKSGWPSFYQPINDNCLKYIKDNSHRIRTNIIPENKKLYLTFDIDAFDISLMPATGTPEPGGLMWNETISLLDEIIKKNKIVAVDVVEFAPIKGIEAYDFVVAKLCYEILRKISNSC